MTGPGEDRPDGLAQLRAMRDAGRRAPMAALMGLELTGLERGLAVMEGTPGQQFYNPLGSVHGGYAATLLDSACGIAVHSQLPADRGYTTLELKVAFHRALTAESGRVRAEGRVVSMGRRVAFTEAKLLDGAGRLCATATSTLLVFEQPAG